MNKIKTLFFGILCCIAPIYANADISVTCTGKDGFCTPGSTLQINGTLSGYMPIVKPTYEITDHDDKTPVIPNIKFSTIGAMYCPSSSGFKCDSPWFASNALFVQEGMVNNDVPASWQDAVNINMGRSIYIPDYFIPDPQKTRWCIAPIITVYWDIWTMVHGYYFMQSKALGKDDIVQFPGICLAPAPAPVPPPATCSIVSTDMDISFGTVERSTIQSATSGLQTTKNGNLSIACTDNSPRKFRVTLNMIPTSWANNQISSSNTALGIAMSEGGSLIGNKESFYITFNGQKTTPLTFSLLRDPNIPSSNINTGVFNASATLIVNEE